MVIKKTISPLGLPFDDGSFSSIQPEFESCYASFMDSSFAALARNIVLHLTPEKVIDTSGTQASTLAVHYNPFQGRAGRRTPSTISTTRQPAVIHTHRNVTYAAHIKHGPKDPDDNGGVALSDNEVQTKLVIAATPHINGALSATIDGRRYKRESVRQIGFQTPRYIIVTWSAINEKENG